VNNDLKIDKEEVKQLRKDLFGSVGDFLKRRWKLILVVLVVFYAISLAGNQEEVEIGKEITEKKEEDKVEEVKEPETELAQKKSEPELVQDKSSSQQYKFIDSKTEKSGKIESIMDLYSFSEEINLDDLKNFLKEKKDNFTGGDFYYLVIFNDQSNAKFPDSPFSSQYGIEEDKQKTIKAMYTYNKLNGYSKLTYYKENMWESEPNTEEI
jgi:hypothetical protein